MAYDTHPHDWSFHNEYHEEKKRNKDNVFTTMIWVVMQDVRIVLLSKMRKILWE